MESEKIARITAFLAQNNENIETLHKSKLEQFKKIDDAIQTRLKEINKAQEVLQNNRINLSTIANDAKIARKTLYNNELLRLYIEQYSTKEKTEQNDYQSLRTTCQEQKEQIRKFLQRDIEIQNLIYENQQLQKEIQLLSKQNRSLEEQCEKNIQRINDLEKKIPNGASRVFRPK